MKILLNTRRRLYIIHLFTLCQFANILKESQVGSNTEEPVIKITGGIEIKIEDAPWLVQIRLNDRQMCAGALLNQEWVLSAAHCFPGWRSIFYMAHLGRQDKYGVQSNVVVRKIIKIIKHPKYGKARRFDSDVALMKLDQKVEYNARIRAVPFHNDARSSQRNLYCCIAGWGETLGQGKTTALNQACLSIYETRRCNNSKIYAGELTENMFCGGYDEGGVDACKGDSGGPIMCHRTSMWVLEGVTSFGIGCGDKPGVYAKISMFSEWIRSTMAKN